MIGAAHEEPDALSPELRGSERLVYLAVRATGARDGRPMQTGASITEAFACGTAATVVPVGGPGDHHAVRGTDGDPVRALFGYTSLDASRRCAHLALSPENGTLV
jgi:hypothetical protein